MIASFREDVVQRVRSYPILGFFLLAHRFFPGAPPGSTAQEVRESYFRLLWSFTTPHERAEFVLRAGHWFACYGLASIRQTGINWRRAKALSGKGLLRQIREQLELGFRLSIHPRDYYRNELHRPENAALAHHYLSRYMFRRRGIYLLLQQNLDERSAEFLIDKGTFFETCSAGGLATAPTLLLVRDGEVVHRDDAALAQARSLFVKPTHGSGGDSTFRLERRANGEFSLGDAGSVSASGLADWLKSLCNDQYPSYMAQLCLKNHPEILELSQSALSTLRIYSMTNEHGEVEIVAATLRMGLADAIVDNYKTGGIAAPVEVDSGALGPATNRGTGRHAMGWIDRHPETGARIAGRQLPLWPEVLDLVTCAHRYFEKTVVGWDVALTPDGPVLVEGNSHPGVDIVQRPQRTPLGRTRFGEIVAYHLERIERRTESETTGNAAMGGGDRAPRLGAPEVESESD